MNIRIIVQKKWECVSQYHQDWECRSSKVIGVFTDEGLFELAMLREPKPWHKLHPNQKYATEGDTSIEWDIQDEIEPNKLYIVED